MSKIWFFQSPGQDGCFVGFSYDQGFVEALKASVPHPHRRWHPDTKLWWVSDIYFSTVLRLGHRWFDEVQDRTQGPESKPTTPSALTNPHSVLYLLPNAPEPVIRAAYKALAKMNHPDIGGDPERMKLINWAYEQLEAGR
jgi:hypothetical protein